MAKHHKRGSSRRIFVAGATGFVGKALVDTLSTNGEDVIAGSRTRPKHLPPNVEWRACDVLKPDTLRSALDGVDVAYFLVHSMSDGSGDYARLEKKGAASFAVAAEEAGVQRIVYLGGVEPPEHVSKHLRSRLEVGEILRGGAVPCIELRASMIIGHESASWLIVRDLALRLPFMILPTWLTSRSRPVALDDVIVALSAAADVEVDGSAWFDIPGPESISGREVLERIAALHGRRVVAVSVPLVTPRSSALWLRLVTRGDYALTRELVLGLGDDLLPKDARYWDLIGHTSLVAFDEAALRALAAERREPERRPLLARIEERIVRTFGPRAASKSSDASRS